jgi:hypothetical protein
MPSKALIVAYLKVFRVNNARLGITGMLLHEDGCFVQLLEGHDDATDNLFAKICADPRHRGAMVLLKRDIEQRCFPDWSMGYTNLRVASLQSIPGFGDFADVSISPAALQAEPHQAVKLFNIFRRNMGV